MNTPIDFRKDPLHKATKIYCDMCKSCEWAHHGYCIYGGPFEDKEKIKVE